MSEITLTDQRPRTTTAEMPDQLKAKKPLPKDPQVQALIEKLKAQFLAQVTPEQD